jgi:hypothetical protein
MSVQIGLGQFMSVRSNMSVSVGLGRFRSV